jgi:negative regulator of flagellin synthesis FlgM
MSYASGIGSLQHAIDPITPAETKPVSQSAAPIANVEHADQASLSPTGGLVAHALETSDTRSAKVASLQQAIAAGTYNVPSSDVADKIIQSLLD